MEVSLHERRKCAHCCAWLDIFIYGYCNVLPDTKTVVGLRDRAIIGVMVCTFARVSAVVKMKIGDYYDDGRRSWFRFHEKGGERHEVPAHHNAQAYVDTYAAAAELESRETKEPLFRSVNRKREITDRLLSRIEVFLMIKRRARVAALPPSTCCHTFRATGITAYFLNGGSLEHAQAIAAHESPRDHQALRPHERRNRPGRGGEDFDLVRRAWSNPTTFQAVSFQNLF